MENNLEKKVWKNRVWETSLEQQQKQLGGCTPSVHQTPPLRRDRSLSLAAQRVTL